MNEIEEEEGVKVCTKLKIVPAENVLDIQTWMTNIRDVFLPSFRYVIYRPHLKSILYSSTIRLSIIVCNIVNHRMRYLADDCLRGREGPLTSQMNLGIAKHQHFNSFAIADIMNRSIPTPPRSWTFSSQIDPAIITMLPR